MIGSSGSGKSTIVTALLEQIRDFAYQFCVVESTRADREVVAVISGVYVPLLTAFTSDGAVDPGAFARQGRSARPARVRR